MSLFQARDWWNAECGSDEGFGRESIAVVNIDNCADGVHKIIVGSHSGILRIFSLMAGKEDDSLRPFQANDLLLEADLTLPILQVTVGTLLAATEKVHLAILHPKKLSVYSVSATAGVAEHGFAYNMLLIYEHNLQRSAYSIVTGPFGNVKGRDFLCVLCLDGTLCFYEQESFAFSRYLPNFLLPGPIAYVNQSDSFIVSTAAWCIESYRYQVLAISKDEDKKEKPSGVGRKAMPDWSIVIGEPAIDIKVVPCEKKSSQVVVLGERNLFVLKETGILHFMKKFDFSPMAMLPYLNDMGELIILVATEMRTLLVYNKGTLKWATQLPLVPVAIRRGTFENINGALVCLSDSGSLSCCYIGTNPSTYILPPTSDVTLSNYSESEQELNELKKLIADLNMEANPMSLVLSGVKNPKGTTSDLSVIISEAQPAMDSTGKISRRSSNCQSILVMSLNLGTTATITELRITLYVSLPLFVEPAVVNYVTLTTADNINIGLTIGAKDSFLPQNLRLFVVATYINANGAPRIFKKHADLPLYTVAKPTTHLKDTNFEQQLTVQCPSIIDLKELFSDVLDLTDSTSAPVDTFSITLGFYDKKTPPVTVLNHARGPQQRLVLKSDSFGALAFVFTELIARLKSRPVKYETNSLLKTDLPLDKYFAGIDDHIKIRRQLVEQQNDLALLSTQFRAVEKRLLVKLKDRNPMPLSNLDLLLESVHLKLLKLSDELMNLVEEYQRSSNIISSSTAMICELIAISANIKAEHIPTLKATLSSYVFPDHDEGWEERIETSVITMVNDHVNDAYGIAKYANRDMLLPENSNSLQKLIHVFIEKVYSGDIFKSTSSKQPAVTMRADLPKTVLETSFREADEYDEV